MSSAARYVAAVLTLSILLELALCDPDVQTRLLFKAVEADDAAAVSAAVAAGARVNERGDKWTQGKQTPLMFASLAGKTRALKALLALNADATLSEKDGYTPMHGAAFQGRADAAAALLAHKSVPNDFHIDGYAPIHRACWGSSQAHTDTVRQFLKAGVPFDLQTRTTPPPIAGPPASATAPH